MAATPRWKVINPQGEYIASCKHTEDAAALVALYGAGAMIRDGRNGSKRVWHEGAEAFEASESYDRVTETIAGRVNSL